MGNTVTKEAVEDLLKQVETATGLTDELRKQAQDFGRQALEDLVATPKAQQSAAAYQAGLERIEADVAELKAAKIPEPEVNRTATIAEVEAKLAETRPLITELQQRLTQPSIDPAARVARRKALRAQLAEIPSQLQAVQSQLDAAAAEGQPPLISSLRRASLLARKQALSAQLSALQLERELYDAEDAAGLPRLRSDDLSRRLSVEQKRLELLTAQLNSLRQKEAAERIAAAQASFREAQPELRELAERNRQIAEEEAETRRHQQSAQTELQQTNQGLDTLQRDFEEARRLEQLIGLTGATGLKLRKQRADLPDTHRLQLRMSERVEKLEESQLALYERAEESQALAQLNETVDTLAAESGLTGEQAQALRDQAEYLLQEQRNYLDSLVKAYTDYTETLTDLDVKERLLVQQSQEFADFIDERILWIRSHQPITLSGIVNDRHVLGWLVDSSFWRDLGRVLWEDAQQHSMIYLAAFVILLILIGQHRRQVRHLRDAATAATARGCTSIGPTLQAVVITILLSLLWPGVMWFLAWRVGASPHTPSMMRDAVPSLGRLAALFLLLELVRQSLRPRGLTDSHFGWSQRAISRIRRHLRWMMILALPFAAAMACTRSLEIDRNQDHIERLFFIAGMMVMAAFSYNLLHPRRGALREVIVTNSTAWVARLDWLWYLLGVGIPVVLAALTYIGFYYTALQISLKVQISAWLILMLVYARALLLRWLMLRHRRLRIEQLRQRASAATANDETERAVIRTNSVPEVSEDADLAASSEQSRRFVNTALTGLVLFGLWATWVDVLPAVRFLDRPAWSSVVESFEEYTDEAGETQFRPVVSVQPITYVDISLAILVMVLAATAARNIPGLLEIAIFQRLPIQRSLAYALTALVRYMLILLGIILTAQMLGIGWSKVQWLAAALTVGLGFGLQEIFANFISGLIILFEQPVRVGDIVTIDGVSGVVNRIRIRATTIVDWDRKEFIVPNKEFITGRVLNWTLTDKLNRITIQVGVAYGSDTDLVKATILEIAQEHPEVLSDSAPIVSFDAFGDSSLNFTLRAYLPRLDYRLQTIDEIHSEIHRRFAKNKIEIPFPQRDLHLRTSVRVAENGHAHTIATELPMTSSVN